MLVTPASLHQLRRESGLTQIELAEEVGVSQSYIARIERGSLDPKLSIVNKIIEVLNRHKSRVCADLMTPNPITVNARNPVSEAIAIMQKHAFSQLPVQRGNETVGLITERDIIQSLHHNLDELSVEAVMSPRGTPKVDESTPIKVIIPLFDVYQAVVIQKQGRITGIITRHDLLKHKSLTNNNERF
jgi:predicted transcriptional regulator